MGKEKLLREIIENGFPEKEVVLDLKSYFEENKDPHSIGVNLGPHPGLEKFYSILKEIKSSPKTENIWVRIADVDDEEWFYSDAIYIIGDWTIPELKDKLEELSPDEIYLGWMYNKPEHIDYHEGKVHSIWWD